MAKGTTENFTVTSYLLNETLDILTYLPPHYSQEKRYPYIIAQDGKDFFQMGRIVRTLDELIQNNVIEPLLFFGIPYKNVQDRRQKYHPSGSKNEAYIQFLCEEMIPILEGKYAVTKDATERALAGDSLAATVSLMTALTAPQTFGKLLLFSPYVDETVLYKTKSFHNWSRITVYHVVGSEETAVKMTDGGIMDFLAANRKLSAYINQGQDQYFYDEFLGNHTWKFWQQDLKRALTYLFPKI